MAIVPSSNAMGSSTGVRCSRGSVVLWAVMWNPWSDSSVKQIKEVVSMLLQMLEEEQELNLDQNHGTGSQAVFDAVREDGIM